MSVELGVVPHSQAHLVVIGTTVRKSPVIVAAYLQSLAWQVCPKQVTRLYCFVDDGSPKETRALLDAFVAEHGGVVWDAEQSLAVDFADDNPVTHQWSNTAMDRVGRSKDRILAFARVERAEAVWFADSDLIMDPMTLTSLWSVPEQIVCAVYWTRWNKVPPEHPPVHAGPQVWLGHPYNLNGLGMEEWEFRRRLVTRQITTVLGQGACTLIRREALLRGVSFAPWPGNTIPGIGQGEDRHFCMRAEALHLKQVADPWPDLFHVYHRPEDEELIPEYLNRFNGSAWTDPDTPHPILGG
jgi:cellulose synthase/poly-beta-1,6-N-acetylglucosamine synthase-like glycosyltransferase